MKIVIAGAGEVGSHLAKMLSNEANDITVIDHNTEHLNAIAATSDVVTITGNPSSIRVLAEANVGKADLFIAVAPSESQDVNIVSAMLAKKLGSKKVTARINTEEYLNPENKYLFTEMGIDLLFYPEKIAANEIADLLRRTAFIDAMDFARGKLQMTVFKLEDDCPILGMSMVEFSQNIAEHGHHFRVVAISRGNDTIIPKFNTKFKYHDVVFIISKRESIEPLMKYIGKKNTEVNRLMILGGTPIGEILAKQMSKNLDTIKIIESDKEKCIELSESTAENVLVVNGDERNSDLLIEESIKNYDAFVAVTESSETNILACVAAKRMGVMRTIAEVENLDYIKLAESMGVDAVINKKLITAGRIFKFTLSNKVRFIKYMNGTNAEVLEFIVSPNSKITKAALKDINFPENAIVGGVIRGNESFIAVGDTQIQAYDRVAVFALPQAVKEVDKMFR